MRVKNLCKFVKTGLSTNLCDFYLCVPAFYAFVGTIKIYAVQIMRLARIVCINKIRVISNVEWINLSEPARTTVQ